MFKFFRDFKNTYKLYKLINEHSFFYDAQNVTDDDKKHLSNLFVRPEYKALVKVWDLGILSLQRSVLTETSSLEDLKVFLGCQKIQNFIKATVYNYHRSYANPNKRKEASPVEGLIEDIEALKKITSPYGKSKS